MTKAKTTKITPKHRRPAAPKLAKRAPKSTAAEMLARLHKAARQVGIQCLDTEWRGKDARYHLRCAHGHEFIRNTNTLTIKGVVCPECRDNAWFARIQAAAVQRGGRCLETRYLGKNRRYRFVCADGHRWSTLPSAVARLGRWCPRCAARQRGLKNLLENGLAQLQAAARARGGVCLTPAYVGIMARYVFRCAEGHEWKATGRQLVRDRVWCLLCANMDKIHVATRPAKQARTTAPEQKTRPLKISPIQTKSKRLQGPRALRKELRLNQQDFWSALGVTQSGGSHYEHGRKLPKPVATLMELVHVKKFKLKKIEAGDMEIISYLKVHDPSLYATLVKAAVVKRTSHSR